VHAFVCKDDIIFRLPQANRLEKIVLKFQSGAARALPQRSEHTSQTKWCRMMPCPHRNPNPPKKKEQYEAPFPVVGMHYCLSMITSLN
jgi:hypothetical protein